MKKLLAAAVVLLFIGVAIAPSINANVSKEMVEFTTEVCGLNGGKQIVKLTQDETKDVKALLDSIRERLNATDSREEAKDIFKGAVVELDKYNLLGGLSIKQARMLVTGEYLNPKIIKYFEKIFDRDIASFENQNFFCLVNGDAGEPICLGFIERKINILCAIILGLYEGLADLVADLMQDLAYSPDIFLIFLLLALLPFMAINDIIPSFYILFFAKAIPDSSG